MKFSSLILSFVSIFSVLAAARTKVPRDSNNLAPILNSGHRHASRRSDTSASYGILLHSNAAVTEKKEFETDFGEFLTKKLPKFDAMYVEIPDNIAEEVLLDIRSRSYVEIVETVLKISHHETEKLPEMDPKKNLHWNMFAVSGKNLENDKDMVAVPTEAGVFMGQGHRVYVYVIDSGIDDHVEFGLRINREKSKGFGSRAPEDSYDCRGHGTMVAGVIAGATTGIVTKAEIVSYAVMDCETGVTTTETILEALHSVLEDIENEYSTGVEIGSRGFVINLSNGLSELADTDELLKLAEEKITKAGGVVVRAVGNLGKEACDYGLQLEDSIRVGSVDSELTMADHSNHGSCVDIFAP
eukprot:Awhi_evm1s8382